MRKAIPGPRADDGRLGAKEVPPARELGPSCLRGEVDRQAETTNGRRPHPPADSRVSESGCARDGRIRDRREGLALLRARARAALSGHAFCDAAGPSNGGTRCRRASDDSLRAARSRGGSRDHGSRPSTGRFSPARRRAQRDATAANLSVDSVGRLDGSGAPSRRARRASVDCRRGHRRAGRGARPRNRASRKAGRRVAGDGRSGELGAAK